MKRVSGLILVLFVFGCLVLTGCGGGSGPSITGAVTIDGAPASDVEVVFEAADRQLMLGGDTIRTDASGKFEIKPHAKKKGLLPGKFAIYVSKWQRRDGKVPPPEELEMEKASGVLVNAIPFSYSNREEGPKFTFEIKPGKNEVGTLAVKTK